MKLTLAESSWVLDELEKVTERIEVAEHLLNSQVVMSRCFWILSEV